MKRFRISVVSLVLLYLVSVLLTGGCAEQETSQIKVVTTTSLIAQIVERVGGDGISVANIIPPAQCPGHFDVTPGEIQKLADADLFLLHGWQGERFSEELIATANNADLTVVRLNVTVGENANWMTPMVQAAAVDKVAEALCQLDADDAEAYRAAVADYQAQITAKETAVKERLAALDPGSVSVLCADQQAGFVGWAGFKIASVFGRPETLTPQVVRDLIDIGRENKVVLVIDNMQSGADAGAGIAEELGIGQLTLSNFPGGYENTSTWEETIDYNVTLLEQALEE